MLAGTDPLELLAEENLVPTKFPYGATGLGRALDPGCSDRNVEENAQLDVPLWLVAPLLQRGMVTAKWPSVYGERYQRKLNAGAECVSFKNKAPFFYEVAFKLNEQMRDVAIADFLSRTFKTRYHELISKGLNTMTGEEVLQLYSKLSREEQELFEGGRISVQETDRWLRMEERQAQPMAMRKKRSIQEVAGNGQPGENNENVDTSAKHARTT